MRQDDEFLDTHAAAALLGRRPQTLRKWSCNRDGPVTPVRIKGRLRWSRAAIEKLHGIERDPDDTPKPESRLPTGRLRGRGTSQTHPTSAADSTPTAAELLDVMAIAYKLARGLEEHLMADRIGSAKRTAALLLTSLEYGRKTRRQT